MSDERFLRKQFTARFFDEDSELLKLLRDMFIEHDAQLCVKELAAAMGVAVNTVYGWFSSRNPLSAEALLFIVRFVGKRDSRLVDLICGEAGYMPMPSDILADAKSLRALLIHAEEILGEGR